MKKILFSNFLFIAMVLFGISCQKDLNQGQGTTPVVQAQSSGLCGFDALDDDSYLELLQDDTDIEGERINLSLYLFGHAIHLALLEPDLKSILISNAQSVTPEHSIEELANNHLILKVFLNKTMDSELEEIAQIYPTYGGISLSDLSTTVTTTNAIQELSLLMHEAGVAYFPTIGLMEQEDPTNFDDIITTIESEVGEEDVNVIPAWDINSNQIALDEDNTYHCENAVLMIGRGFDDATLSPDIVIISDDTDSEFIQNGTNSVSPRTVREIRWKKIQIKNPYFFERRRNNLEVKSRTHVFGSSQGGSFTSDFSREQDVWWRDVKNSKTQSIDRRLFQLDASTEILNYITVWYERDWYVLNTNKKIVSFNCTTCNPQKIFAFQLRMKGQNEFYNKTGGRFFTDFPNVGSQRVISNSKSSFTIERTK